VTRAGKTTPFWWGASISPQQANYAGNYIYGNGPKGEYRQRTVPVSSFQPNPWGLYQVHGNVWEWTEDCYYMSYVDAPKDGSAETTGRCLVRTLRGGSWYNYPWNLRGAKRSWNFPGSRVNDYGFRLGRTLNP
jgi:formylglycine-generating enzyme required for sulfatase activity